MPCGRESMAKASADATSPLVAYLTTQGLNVPQLSALIRCATTRSRRDCAQCCVLAGDAASLQAILRWARIL